VETHSYPGTELELFLQARNWKAYWSGIVRRYVKGSALEVGAGIGANIALLYDAAERWVCCEPDPQLCASLKQRVEEGDYERCQVICGSIKDVASDLFDTILYIDVLEHISNDSAELQRAASRLRPGGHLVVLAPAHQWLFSPFDKAIGHYRRYDAEALRACVPSGFRTETTKYLDSVGLLASLANKWLLGQSQPTERQVGVWDKLMIPISRVLDLVSGYRFGKSVLMVFVAPGTTSAGT